LATEFPDESLRLLNLGCGTESEENYSLILSISKLIYGSTDYYMNLQFFLQYYHRSLSKLSRFHPFYKNEATIATMYEILGRLFDNNLPTSLLIEGSDELDPKSYRQLTYLLSVHMMRNETLPGISNMYILASMLGVEFIIIEERSNEFELSKETNTREWKFNFQRTFNGNKFINDALIKQNLYHQPKNGWCVCLNPNSC
jgi:hypothetical protein